MIHALSKLFARLMRKDGIVVRIRCRFRNLFIARRGKCAKKPEAEKLHLA
jgi:hypothetical protein